MSCEKAKSVDTSAAPASPSSVARALGLDAAAFALEVDPPAPPGDLKADLDQFKSLDQCLHDHGKLDPLVGDGLRAIGYDTFLRDTCRLLEAIHARDRAKCSPIDASTLRTRCEAFVAMAAATPDACPWDLAGTPARGRETTCVAVASKDRRLCASEPRYGRFLCEALVMRDATKCDALAEPERGACRREVLRWRNVLEPPLEGLAPLPKMAASITLHGIEGSSDPSPKDADLAPDLARGVVVLQQAGRVRIELGSVSQVGSTAFLAPSPTARVRLAARLSIGTELSDARIEHLELDVPASGTLVVPGVRNALRLTVRRFDRTRAGEFSAMLEGVIGVSPRAYRVHVDLTTFVRDVVSETAQRDVRPR